MSVVTVGSQGWTAEVRSTTDLRDGDWIHLEARVVGDTQALALTGARWIMDNFGKGRACMVRAEPEAATERDFDTKEDIHRGYVRFSWENSPHQWHRAGTATLVVPYISAA